jgi:hypothetical protein
LGPHGTELNAGDTTGSPRVTPVSRYRYSVLRPFSFAYRASPGRFLLHILLRDLYFLTRCLKLHFVAIHWNLGARGTRARAPPRARRPFSTQQPLRGQPRHAHTQNTHDIPHARATRRGEEEEEDSSAAGRGGAGFACLAIFFFFFFENRPSSTRNTARDTKAPPTYTQSFSLYLFDCE